MHQIDIRKQYLKLMPTLNKVVSFVKDKLDNLPMPDFEVEINFKPIDSVIRKCELRKFKDITELSDLVRGRIFFSDKYQYKDLINYLKRIFKNQIDKIEWKDEHNKAGYQGVVHFDLKVNGINFELQVLPVEFKKYKEPLHHIYDFLRDEDNGISSKTKNKLYKLHHDVYEKLTEKALSNRSESN